jgi:hypothetical protein
MPVYDKPVVLVSDKPVEIKPLVDEKKDIAACPIVCVDIGSCSATQGSSKS